MSVHTITRYVCRRCGRPLLWKTANSFTENSVCEDSESCFRAAERRRDEEEVVTR